MSAGDAIEALMMEGEKTTVMVGHVGLMHVEFTLPVKGVYEFEAYYRDTEKGRQTIAISEGGNTASEALSKLKERLQACAFEVEELSHQVTNAMACALGER